MPNKISSRVVERLAKRLHADFNRFAAETGKGCCVIPFDSLTEVSKATYRNGARRLLEDPPAELVEAIRQDKPARK